MYPDGSPVVPVPWTGCAGGARKLALGPGARETGSLGGARSDIAGVGRGSPRRPGDESGDGSAGGVTTARWWLLASGPGPVFLWTVDCS